MNDFETEYIILIGVLAVVIACAVMVFYEPLCELFASL